MAKALNPIPQPQTARMTSDSMSRGRARRPSAKLQAMQGKFNYLSYASSIDRAEEEHEQEQATHEQEALAKAKRREERNRKRDQVSKAAQQDPAQPSEAPAVGPNVVPTMIDNAVCRLSYNKYPT